MDDWDAPAYKPKLMCGDIPCCDMRPRMAIHRIWDNYYISLYRRSKEGVPFKEIKQSEEYAERFAVDVCAFLSGFIADKAGWCIVTTPRRRHYDCFHFATDVCRRVSEKTGIPFYDGAVQTLNKDRLHPDFCLLRQIEERKVIVYDDIITTGSTLIATSALFADREFILNLVSISNR